MFKDLKQIRDEKGYTRKFVAQKLEIHPGHLTMMEGGRARLTEANAVKLAAIYGMEPIEVIKASGQMIEDERKLREELEGF